MKNNNKKKIIKTAVCAMAVVTAVGLSGCGEVMPGSNAGEATKSVIEYIQTEYVKPNTVKEVEHMNELMVPPELLTLSEEEMMTSIDSYAKVVNRRSDGTYSLMVTYEDNQNSYTQVKTKKTTFVITDTETGAVIDGYIFPAVENAFAYLYNTNQVNMWGHVKVSNADVIQRDDYEEEDETAVIDNASWEMSTGAPAQYGVNPVFAGIRYPEFKVNAGNKIKKIVIRLTDEDSSDEIWSFIAYENLPGWLIHSGWSTKKVTLSAADTRSDNDWQYIMQNVAFYVGKDNRNKVSNVQWTAYDAKGEIVGTASGHVSYDLKDLTDLDKVIPAGR